MNSIKSYVHKLTILLNLQDGMQNLLPCSQTTLFFSFFLFVFLMLLKSKAYMEGMREFKEVDLRGSSQD